MHWSKTIHVRGGGQAPEYPTFMRVLVGTPTANRGSADLTGTVGYLVNPVVIRSDLSADPTFDSRQLLLGLLEIDPTLVATLTPLGLDSALLDIMYDTPGQTVSEVIINEDVIEKPRSPLITYLKESKVAEG